MGFEFESGEFGYMENEKGTVLVKPTFVPQHIQSAAFFARQAYAMEQCPKTAIVQDHHAYVIGAIDASVMFLEAMINHIFIAVAKEFEFQYLLSNQARQALTDAWNGTATEKPIDRRKNILDKYCTFLDLAERTSFNKGTRPYQDVKHLIALRNDLTHYKPTWRAIQPTDKETDQERYLRSQFAPSPLADPSATFLYEKCLGHGCAEWAVVQSLEFVDQFYSLAHLNEYWLSTSVRQRLATR